MEVEVVKVVFEIRGRCPRSVGSQDVRVVVHPRFAADHIRDWLRFVQERRTVLADEQEFLIEKVSIDTPDLASCAVVRYRSWPLGSHVGIDGHSPAIEELCTVGE